MMRFSSIKMVAWDRIELPTRGFTIGGAQQQLCYYKRERIQKRFQKGLDTRQLP